MYGLKWVRNCEPSDRPTDNDIFICLFVLYMYTWHRFWLPLFANHSFKPVFFCASNRTLNYYGNLKHWAFFLRAFSKQNYDSVNFYDNEWIVVIVLVDCWLHDVYVEYAYTMCITYRSAHLARLHFKQSTRRQNH